MSTRYGNADVGSAGGGGFEVISLEKTRNVCPVCEDYATQEASKPVAVMCCEEACLRGEVARQAANLLCHSLLPDQTVRICLGGAFTKDAGQRALVRNAARVVALEGCFLNCASQMIRGVIPTLAPEIVVADRLYGFDRRRFGIDEMPQPEIARHARALAQQVADRLRA